MAIYPAMIELIIPKIIAVILKLVTPFETASPTLSKPAPPITGMDKIKEKRAASSFFRPCIREAVIVLPDLDIPGIIAIPWAIPTNTAFNHLKLDIMKHILMKKMRESVKHP